MQEAVERFLMRLVDELFNPGTWMWLIACGSAWMAGFATGKKSG